MLYAAAARGASAEERDATAQQVSAATARAKQDRTLLAEHKELSALPGAAVEPVMQLVQSGLGIIGSDEKEYHIIRGLFMHILSSHHCSSLVTSGHLVITSLLITSGLNHQIICHQSSKPRTCPRDVSELCLTTAASLLTLQLHLGSVHCGA